MHVLVDTDVVSRSLLPARVSGKRGASTGWSDALEGRTIAIAVQTRVELLAWPRLRNWSERRRSLLEDWVANVPAIDVTPEVQDAFVALTVEANRVGHGIHEKVHVADRWIAATAIAAGLPLASGDGIFNGIDGLELLEPGR